MADDQKIPDEIVDEATCWVIERDAGLTPAESLKLDQWLAGAPLHRQAFAQAEKMWQAMGNSAVRSEVYQRRTLPDREPGYPPLERSFLAPSIVRRRWFAPAVAASLAVIMVGASSDWSTALRADAMTGTGEQRRIVLDDQSVVQLNTNSAISIDYQDNQRVIRLLKGEAAFTVAPDRKRPFTVEAGKGTTMALGTRFVIRRLGDDTQVAVTEHAVRVSSGTGTRSAGVTVSEGQSVVYDAKAVSRPAAADNDASTAWTRGRLVFVDRPLREVVAELSRYHKGYIGLMGTELGERRVSGVFRTDDPVAAIATLQRSLGVSSARMTDRLILLYN